MRGGEETVYTGRWVEVLGRSGWVGDATVGREVRLSGLDC